MLGENSCAQMMPHKSLGSWLALANQVSPKLWPAKHPVSPEAPVRAAMRCHQHTNPNLFVSPAPSVPTVGGRSSACSHTNAHTTRARASPVGLPTQPLSTSSESSRTTHRVVFQTEAVVLHCLFTRTHFALSIVPIGSLRATSLRTNSSSPPPSARQSTL